LELDVIRIGDACMHTASKLSSVHVVSEPWTYYADRSLLAGIARAGCS